MSHQWISDRVDEVYGIECFKCGAFVTTTSKELYDYLMTNPPKYKCLKEAEVSGKCAVCGVINCHCKNFLLFKVAVFEKMVIVKIANKRLVFKRK